MLRLSIIRAIKSGVNNFFRNGWLSITSVSVVSLTLFVISFLMSIVFVSNKLFTEIRNKIGVNVYLNEKADKEIASQMMEEISLMGGVTEVEYTDKKEALTSFKQKVKENDIIIQAIDELRENPLEDFISIKVKDPRKYEIIEGKLITGEFKDYILKVDYSEHKTEINNLDKILSSVTKAGLILIVFLVFVAVMVVLNSIRLTMYTHKIEIEIMRLVGAGNWFIKLPFITEGALYGLAASILVTLSLYPLAILLASALENSGLQLNPILLLNQTIIFAFLIHLLIGIALGIFSSYVAIQRYLRI
ncbi:MAG: FtsX-like permease family protein [Candidatus Moranbacteria bacterium]|nr:FtsX-like permease family protein [Candidatus Moranbacteria bacterium]